MEKLTFYWHFHHDVLVEPLLSFMSLKTRKNIIKNFKPKDQIETRLRLLKLVKGNLPIEFIEAWKTYDKDLSDVARLMKFSLRENQEHKRAKANENRLKALENCEVMEHKYQSQLEVLHGKECPDCPWDGETIFPEKV